MHCYPLTRQGGLDLVIGKDDGLIEIYNIDDQDRVTLRQTYVRHSLKRLSLLILI